MSIAINGIGETVISLKTTTDVAIGDFVTLSANQTAVKASVGADPIGVCVSKNGNYIGVQIAGGVTASQDGTVTLGYCAVKATATGLAKATTGTPRLVVSITDTTADIIL